MVCTDSDLNPSEHRLNEFERKMCSRSSHSAALSDLTNVLVANPDIQEKIYSEEPSQKGGGYYNNKGGVSVVVFGGISI